MELRLDNQIYLYYAGLKARLERTRKSNDKRLNTRVEIYKKLLERGWDKDKILGFDTFMNGVMRLTEDLQIRYYDKVHRVEEIYDVNYISSAEQFGIEKGMRDANPDIMAARYAPKGLRDS